MVGREGFEPLAMGAYVKHGLYSVHPILLEWKALNTDELASLVHKLTDILCEIDLLNICDVPDEYEPEARDIAERLLVQGEELSPRMLKEVFEKWFGGGCCSEEEYVAAYQVLTRSSAEDGIRARDLYRNLLDKSESE